MVKKATNVLNLIPFHVDFFFYFFLTSLSNRPNKEKRGKFKKKKNMKPFKKPHLLNAFLLLLLNINYLSSSTAYEDVQFIKFCGKHQIQTPFVVQKSSNLSSSPIKNLILCMSQKLYYRTSIGLFPISSINYTTKTLTISHPASCSNSLHYVSPSILSAGFPSPPNPNSLLLFNCSNPKHHFPPYIRSHSCLNACRGSTSSSSCLVVEDLGKLPMGFHPRDLNCTYYSRVYKKSSDDGYELGTRISFDIPDHVPFPDICSECQKPNGNCGVGLKCICHLKDCKDKVVSKGKSMKNSVGNMLVTLLSFVAVIVLRS